MGNPKRQFTGPELGKSGWVPSCLPDLTGKTFVITGANSGIGLEAARMLGRRGGTVILACRDEVKAREAIAELHRVSPANCDYRFVPLDLADLSSVREAARLIRAMCGTGIDAVINNAGLMMIPEQCLSVDGHEMHFAVNHLGHFALAGLLSDLVETAGGRFVTVSSLAHKRVRRLDFDNINLDGYYAPARAYAASKLANLLFASELQRRLERAGAASASLACHPGMADTNIAVTGPSRAASLMMVPFIAVFSQTAHKGARPAVLAAAGEEARAGGYYGPTGWMGMTGRVDRAEIAPQALDEEAGRRLWAMSEAMTGVVWPDFRRPTAPGPSETDEAESPAP